MLGAVDQLREALRVEADDEILSVGDDGNAGTAGELPPLAEKVDVAGDVELIVFAVPFIEPSLGVFAVGSSRSSVDLDPGHGISSSG